MIPPGPPPGPPPGIPPSSSAPPPLPPGIAPDDLEGKHYDDDDDDSEGSTSESGGEGEEYDPAVPLERSENVDDRDEEMGDSEGGTLIVFTKILK